MVSLLLVFGTMVEFSVVLVAKQKYDWDCKAIDSNGKPWTIRVQESYDARKTNSNIETISQIEGKDNMSAIKTNDEHLTPSQILNHLTLSENMPPYRKTDIVAFILFSSFYLCFNIIYFVVCINY